MQSAPNLRDSWQLQAVRIAATHTTQTRFVLPQPDPQAFYRIVVLP